MDCFLFAKRISVRGDEVVIQTLSFFILIRPWRSVNSLEEIQGEDDRWERYSTREFEFQVFAFDKEAGCLGERGFLKKSI